MMALRVAIVGGGIGGLAAALACVRNGMEVTVYEQAAVIAEIGAGVQIAPNGLRQLRRLGIGKQIERIFVPYSNESRYRRSDGKPVSNVPVTGSDASLPVGGVHRADFIDVLRDALPAGTVHVNHQVVHVENSSQGPRVTTADGTTYKADVIVGADGIHSVVRAAVTERAEPVFSKRTAYRGTVKQADLQSWPRDQFEVWMGHGKHLLTFPVRGGDEINYVGFVPADAKMQESWTAPGSPNELRSEFAGWDPRVEELLELVTDTKRWGLYDREPLERWTNGSICLLGDAAHAMLPHVGQGANQAIEDGVVLGALLAQADRENVPRLLQAYENARLARTAKVQAGSRENGLRYESQYDDLDKRDAEAEALRAFRYEIYDFDPLAELTLNL